MASVHSKNLNIFNAEQFKDSVTQFGGNTRLYLTYGKTTPWEDDMNPPQANTSVTAFNDIWYNMVGAKVITSNDMYHVIKRFTWTPGTVYDAYHHCDCSLELFNENTKFYVVTDEWNVYKCIYNNEGTPSYAKPTGQELEDIQTYDGYVWKFMYNISAAEQLKFTTSVYMPVKTLKNNDNSLQWRIQNGAIPGAIHALKVIDGGSGYSSSANLVIRITGDGINANAVVRVNTTSKMISNAVMFSIGSGYTKANVSVVDYSPNPGSGALLEAILSPPGGHGSDPMRELGGSNLMLNVRIKGTEGTVEKPVLAANCTYRQIAIIKDPYFNNTNKVPSNTAISQLVELTCLPGSGQKTISAGDTIYQGDTLETATMVANVVEVSDNIVKINEIRGTITANNITTLQLAQRRVQNIKENTLEPFSGQLLYIDYREPTQRSPDQTEDYKIVIKF